MDETGATPEITPAMSTQIYPNHFLCNASSLAGNLCKNITNTSTANTEEDSDSSPTIYQVVAVLVPVLFSITVFVGLVGN